MDLTRYTEFVRKLNEQIDTFTRMRDSILEKIAQHSNQPRLKTAVVFTLTSNAGFASVFGFLCKTYIYAQVNQYDFYIDHRNWQYTYANGWHDYFTTLKLYNPAAAVDYGKVEYYSWHNIGQIPDYTLQQYHDCVDEIFKLKDDLLACSAHFIETIGGEYDSVYVRRGDKLKENEYTNIQELIASIPLDPMRKLFVQTDDIHAFEEIRKLLPDKKLYTITPYTSRGADMFTICSMNAEDRRKHTEELLISIAICMKGSAIYSDNRSNIGRLHKIIGLDAVTLYPSSASEIPLSMATVIRPQYDLM